MARLFLTLLWCMLLPWKCAPGSVATDRWYPGASINSMNTMRQAVVSVHTTKTEAALSFEGKIINKVGRCAGVVVSSDGLVLTAKHCIEKRLNNNSVKVKYMGDKIPAEIVDISLFYDLALLSIGGTNRNFLNLCPDVEVGSRVYIFGFPQKYPSVLYAEIVDNEFGILTSTAITAPGYSGGPVIEDRRECVVGINYFRYTTITGKKSRHVSLDMLEKMLKGED